MGPLGWQETVFIFVLALLIFGPKKLPELGKTIGKALTEFRRASNELKSTFEREMHSLERDNESLKELKEITSSYHNELQSYNYDSSYNYNYGYEENYYGSGSNDSTATNPSTVSASATEGAESTTSAVPDSGPPASGSEAEAPLNGTAPAASESKAVAG